MLDRNWVHEQSAEATIDVLNELSKVDGLMDRDQEELVAGVTAIIERRFLNKAGE